MPEIRRIGCCKKLWFLLLFLLMVQVAVFLFLRYIEHDNFQLYVSSYKAALEKYSAVEYGEAAEKIEAQEQMASGWEDIGETSVQQDDSKEAANKIKEQLMYLASYEQYLEEVKTNAERQMKNPLFSKEGSYTQKNIEKTGKDFGKLEAAQVRLGSNLAAEAVFKEEFLTQGLLLMFLCAILLQIFRTRENGLEAVVYATPNGRLQLVISRILIFGVWGMFAGAALHGVKIVTACILYQDWGEFSRSIQSLPAFQKCTAVLTIGQYISIWAILQSIGAVLVGLIAWLFLAISGNNGKGFILSVFFLIAEYLFFVGISDNSRWIFLRCVNVFSYLDSSLWYQKYLNIEILGSPILVRTLLFILYPLIWLVLSGLISMIHVLRRPYHVSAFSFPMGRYIRKWMSKYETMGGILWKEIDKRFRLQGGIAVVILFIWLLFIRDGMINLYQSNEELLLNSYLSQYAGLIGEDAWEYLEEEYKKLENDTEMESLWNNIQRNSLSMFEEELKRLSGSQNQTGGYLIPFEGYRLLIGQEFSKYRQLKFLGLLLCFCLICGDFSWERQHRVKELVRSTVNGREIIFKKKTAIWIFILILGTIITQISAVYWMFRSEGSLSYCFSSIQNLMFMKDFPIRMPILFFLLGAGLIQIAGSLCIGGILAGISSLCNKKRSSVFVSVLVLIVPNAVMLALGKVDISYMLLPLWDFSSIWRINTRQLLASYSVFFLFGILGYTVSWMKWKEYRK